MLTAREGGRFGSACAEGGLRDSCQRGKGWGWGRVGQGTEGGPCACGGHQNSLGRRTTSTKLSRSAALCAWPCLDAGVVVPCVRHHSDERP